jgi:hypothetical protein
VPTPVTSPKSKTASRKRELEEKLEGGIQDGLESWLCHSRQGATTRVRSRGYSGGVAKAMDSTVDESGKISTWTIRVVRPMAPFVFRNRRTMSRTFATSSRKVPSRGTGTKVETAFVWKGKKRQSTGQIH